MATPNPEAFFDGEFYEENSFLVLAKGDELSAHSSPNTSLANKSADPQNSQPRTANVLAVEPNVSSVPKPLPRSNMGQGSTAMNANVPVDEPVSSHFGSIQAQGPCAGSSGVEALAAQLKKSAIDQPEVSLASIISSNSSMTPSETESLEESLKLIHILKTENEGLKEIISQRNETLRDEIKSIHSTSAMYESKHADQLEKYNTCMKAVSELRVENAQLKAQLAERVIPDKNNLAKVETLEKQLEDQRARAMSLQNEIQRYVDIVKDYDAKITSLSEQEKAQRVQTESLVEQRDAIQFELTDAKITMANLSDELRKYKSEGSQASSLSGSMSNDHLESALRAARLHLTNMKEDSDKKNEVISTLAEQKQFFEAQMKEFEANFKEERDEKQKLADTLSLLQIELEKFKSELTMKTEELEKLHRSHLVLANEHLNRNREDSSIGSPPGPDEFVFINRQRQPQNVSNEQVQTAPPSAPFVGGQNAAAAMPAPAPQQPPELPLGTCPLCFKKFGTPDAVVRHAANCGVSLTPGQNPFLFP